MAPMGMVGVTGTVRTSASHQDGSKAYVTPSINRGHNFTNLEASLRIGNRVTQ